MVAVRRKHVATKKKAPDVEIGCLVLFVTQSFPRRDFPKAASAKKFRVGQNRYIWQMFEAEATRHYKPQCKKAYGFIRWALISVLE